MIVYDTNNMSVLSADTDEDRISLIIKDIEYSYDERMISLIAPYTYLLKTDGKFSYKISQLTNEFNLPCLAFYQYIKNKYNYEIDIENDLDLELGKCSNTNRTLLLIYLNMDIVEKLQPDNLIKHNL